MPGPRASFPCSNQNQTLVLIICHPQARLLTFECPQSQGFCPFGSSGWLCLLPRQELGEGVQGDFLEKEQKQSTKERGGATQQPLPTSSTASPSPYPLPSTPPSPTPVMAGVLFVSLLPKIALGFHGTKYFAICIPFQSAPPPDLNRVSPQ